MMVNIFQMPYQNTTNIKNKHAHFIVVCLWTKQKQTRNAPLCWSGQRVNENAVVVLGYIYYMLFSMI